jgi:transposase InsO family protein
MIGVAMYLHPTTTYGSLIPGSEYIRSLVRQGTISKEAQKRLRWFEYYRDCSDVSLTCRHFGISRPTFYRWKNRFDPYDLTTLEESSRRPHRVRQSETPVPDIERIRVMRQTYPRWGKEKLAVLLRQEGIQISGSTVGRQMAKLRKRGLLVEPENVRQAKLARKRRRKPRYAVRKPKGYAIKNPGDMVQVDTLQIILCPNEVRFQIGARDIVTRMDVLKAYKRQTSTAAADFLQYMKKKFPFKIRAIQIDGGSEFMDQFEEACQKENILLCVNPPRCPEMNGYIERSNRTSREEFYEVEEVSLNLEEHNRQLAKWEYTYNYIRPHQALDYLTPNKYYLQWKKNQKAKCH